MGLQVPSGTDTQNEALWGGEAVNFLGKYFLTAGQDEEERVCFILKQEASNRGNADNWLRQLETFKTS
jgi:hypothetical protein